MEHIVVLHAVKLSLIRSVHTVAHTFVHTIVHTGPLSLLTASLLHAGAAAEHPLKLLLFMFVVKAETFKEWTEPSASATAGKIFACLYISK